MNNALMESLFKKYVPGTIAALSKRIDEEGEYLNICHRLIDEFWIDNAANFVRHGTQKLGLVDGLDSGKVSVEVLIQTFMSAEVERRIEPPMTIEQRERLGVVYEQVGKEFFRRRWTSHARFSFSRAAHLFGDLRLHQREDDCWYLEARAGMAQGNVWQRIRAWPLFAFAGFGYRPYRLLYFCIITIFVFAAIYGFVQPSWSLFKCASVSAMNYLSALGYGDVSQSSPVVQSLVVVQGFASLVLNSTLFALLVRRWFRT